MSASDCGARGTSVAPRVMSGSSGLARDGWGQRTRAIEERMSIVQREATARALATTHIQTMSGSLAVPTFLIVLYSRCT